MLSINITAMNKLQQTGNGLQYHTGGWVTDLPLIHYGSAAFNQDLFRPVENSYWCKPVGGLWFSMEGINSSWERWCRANEFNVESLEQSWKARFKETAKVYCISRYSDLIGLPALSTSVVYGLRSATIDFETVVSSGIDAIYLTAAGEVATRYTDPFTLNGVNCCVLQFPGIYH